MVESSLVDPPAEPDGACALDGPLHEALKQLRGDDRGRLAPGLFHLDRPEDRRLQRGLVLLQIERDLLVAEAPQKRSHQEDPGEDDDRRPGGDPERRHG